MRGVGRLWSHNLQYNTNSEYERHLFVTTEHREYFNSDSKDLTPEQKAHYGPTVRAPSIKTQPVYCPLLDTIFLFLASPFHR